MCDRPGLFDNLSHPSIPKSLFPSSNISAPSHGLFGFSFDSPQGNTGCDASSSGSMLEPEQQGLLHTEKVTSGQLAESLVIFPFSSESWISDSIATQPSDLFSTWTSQTAPKDGPILKNLFPGLVTSTGLPHSSLEVSNERDDLGVLLLPPDLHPTSNSISGKQTSIAKPVKQKNLVPMTVKLHFVPPSQNQKDYLRKVFSKFGEIEGVISQPSTATALILFSDFAAAQKAKWEAGQLIPGIVASCERFSHMEDESAPLSFLNSSSLPNMSHKDTFGLAGSTASTVEERLTVLEANNKAEHERKQAACGHPLPVGDLSKKQSVTVGTCPDMCPETERYLRELRQRVSVFECQSGTSGSAPWQMDHTRAVKDYSRSAADQAEPLPHELRAPEVLEQTMNYLLAAIADRPEIDATGNLWKPWYEFLWTRTRAIRKDITQQRLCSFTIVSIVEKITRFHIFCAARLVDQSMDAFDPRINSENLTQCLQTLKELYSDLRSTPTDSCPCEPEFRAYMILMKLNDSSVLDEVQKFPHVLRKSAEVQFAIAVHSAVTEHNHVRFFRLVRVADCLTACLLHRYFGQVRSHALFALSAAFCGHPRHEVAFPLSSFMHQLGFESRKDTQAFCEHWNLRILGSDLIFKRNSPPRVPELPWQERRSPNLIEGKRASISLADLFNGGPIDPAHAKPRPIHSSFDVEGRFLSVPEVQESPYCPSPTNLTPLPFSMTDREISFVSTKETNHEDSSDIQPRSPVFKLDSLFAEAPESMFTEEIRSDVSMTVFNEMIDNEIRRVASTDLKEARTIESVADDLIEETVEYCANQILEEEIVLRLDYVSSIAGELADGIIRTGVHDSLWEVASDIINMNTVLAISDDIIMEVLSDFASKVLLKSRSKYFNSRLLLKYAFRIWKAVCLGNRRRELHARNLLRFMPAAPAALLWLGDFSTPGNRLQTFPDKDDYGLKRARLSLSSNVIDADLACRPFDSIQDLFRGAHVGVVISSASHVFSQWLCNKLRNYSNFIFLPSIGHLTGKETGIIVVGAAPYHLGIPQLHLYLSDFKGLARHSNSVKSITFPPLVEGTITMAYCWSTLLRTGLQWLAEKASIGAHDVRTVVKNDKKAAYPLSSLRSSTLAEVASAQIQAVFLTPLLTLIDHWREQGLTHPDSHCILQAYNHCLSLLPIRVRESLVISPLPEPLPPSVSWHDAVNIWHSFLLTTQLSEHVILSCQLPPEQWGLATALLIPWGSLCIRLVCAKLDAVLGEETKMLSVPAAINLTQSTGQIFDQLGPQFSIASITRELQSCPPSVWPPDQDRRPREPFASGSLITGQLKELNAKIEKISTEVRTIFK